VLCLPCPARGKFFRTAQFALTLLEHLTAFYDRPFLYSLLRALLPCSRLPLQASAQALLFRLFGLGDNACPIARHIWSRPTWSPNRPSDVPLFLCWCPFHFFNLLSITHGCLSRRPLKLLATQTLFPCSRNSRRPDTHQLFFSLRKHLYSLVPHTVSICGVHSVDK
jgi:hypothetical protein